MNAGERAIERAVVFEYAAGYRLVCAQRCLAAWTTLFGKSLLEADLALNAEGPVLYVIARFDGASDVESISARFSAVVNHAGGTEVPLEELSLLERANFLTRVEQCVHRREQAPPEGLNRAFEELFAAIGAIRDPRRTQQVWVNPAPSRPSAPPPPVAPPPEVDPYADEVVFYDDPVEAPVEELPELTAELAPEPVAAEAPELVGEIVGELSPPEDLALEATEELLAENEPEIVAEVDADFSPTVIVSESAGIPEAEAPRPPAVAPLVVVPSPKPAVSPPAASPAPRLAELVSTSPAVSPPAPRLEELASTSPAVSPPAAPAAPAPAAEPPVDSSPAPSPKPSAPPPLPRPVPPPLTPAPKPPPLPLAATPAVGATGFSAPIPAITLDEAQAQSLASVLASMPAPPAPLAAGPMSSLAALTASPMPHAGARPSARLGRYEVRSLLGRGAMGEVHFAVAVDGPRTGQFVAIKRLPPARANDPRAVEEFLAESQTLALFRHPNIVKTYEAGEIDGQQCLVMEAVDGHDLSQLLRRCRQRKLRLPIDFSCALMIRLLAGLDCVHRATSESGDPLKLVHCDVSPNNVFISRQGEVKLGDFGSAKTASDVANARGWAEGKPSYLSPEALDGKVSPQSDLWAAAVIFYELLTLELPFRGDSFPQLMEAIRKASWSPPHRLRPEISPEIAAVLKKALERKPKHRFRTAADFRSAITNHFDAEADRPAAIAAVVESIFPHSSAH